MSAEALLSQLEATRKTGADRWTARCPSHGDKHASLSIRELSDGRTLIHCFAGCSVHEVLAAAGLEMDALFREKPISAGHSKRPERRPYNAHDALRALAHEVTVVRLCSASMRSGLALSDDDDARLSLAFTRLVAAETLINAR